MPAHLVAAVAYDGLCTFEFGCVVELFSLHRPELGVRWYEFGICAAERKPLRAAGGFTLNVPHTLRLLDRADTIVVPGWRNADEPVPPELLRKLKNAHSRGARLCSICSGVFVLAAAGVLDGKSATTHWRYVDKLRQRFPTIRVRPNELYVDEGQIITSAGSAAGLDMLLHLVRRDYGPRIANQVAQRLVIPPHREGGQAQFLPRPMPLDERDPLGPLMEWVRINPQLLNDLHSMVRRVGLRPSTLNRHLRAAYAMSPRSGVVRDCECR